MPLHDQPDRFPHRIRNSIIIYFLTSVLTCLILLSATLYHLSKHQLEQEMGKRLVAIATMAANSLQPWLINQIRPTADHQDSADRIRNRLLQTTRTGQISRAYLFTLNDQSLADTDPHTPIGTPYFDHQSLYATEIAKVRNGIPTHTEYFIGKDGKPYKKSFVPVTFESRVIAVLGVQASADFFEDLRRIRRYIFYSIGFVCLLIIAVGLFVSKKIVKPIEQLIHAAKRIGAGDLNTALTINHRNEFGVLAASIDEMRIDLREKEQRMQAMLQGIAHEVRNPLGGIELFAGLLSEDIAKKNKEQHQSVEKIKDEVKNLKVIIEQFLDFARELSPQQEWVDARIFVEDVVMTTQLMSQEALVKITTAIASDVDQIWIDPRMMRQVLLNIIRNSIQAIDKPDGKVHVAVKRSVYENQNGVELSIQDNGSGIPPEEMENIFRPFYTTKEKGCGLGLAFCHKIVHSHEGTMQVESSPQTGTNMVIWLPSGEQS